LKPIKSVIVAVGLVASALATGGTVLVGTTAASAASAKSCVASQIKVTHGPRDGVAGTIYFPIIFTNTGATCTIYGAPAIQPVTGSTHRVVGPSASSEAIGLKQPRHTLAKGHSVSSAYGVVATGNFSAKTCVAQKVSGVLVKLGSIVPSTYVSLPITVCSKRSSTTTRLIATGVTGN